MTKTNFYAICARGENAEDGFYKVKAENFGERVNFIIRSGVYQNIKSTLMSDFKMLTNFEINFANRKMHASGGWHDEIAHKPVAFVLEVNSHLPRPKISFDKEVRVFDSVDNVGDEPINSQSPSESAGVQNQTKDEAKEQFNDIQNAKNNAKIVGEALKDRLITKAFKDSEHLRAIYKKIKIDTAIYFEDEDGKIRHLWYERGESEESGAIKALMMNKKAFVVADLCESEKPLIRFCKGFKSEWLDENGEIIKDYE